MKNRVLVDVKARHIADGHRCRTYLCPIALALQEQFQDVSAHMVIRLAHVGGIVYEVSKRATKFVEDFDGGKEVKPFRFWMVRKTYKQHQYVHREGEKNG